ncbi:MAG TPA: dTMP kinase [Candidatus Kryptonia bacterium]
MFIVFEGIDGSGKTTQAELLFKRLSGLGTRVELLREPGGTKLGEGVRELLLHRADLDINANTEFLLFSASRAQLVAEKIIPMLNQDITVIVDRYFYSSIAYQGFGRGIPISSIEAVSEFATQALAPDIVFLIRLDAKTAVHRRKTAKREADRMEDSEIRFFEKVNEGFEYCARKEPDRFVIVDGMNTIEKIAENIFDAVALRMKRAMEERNAK